MRLRAPVSFRAAFAAALSVHVSETAAGAVSLASSSSMDSSPAYFEPGSHDGMIVIRRSTIVDDVIWALKEGFRIDRAGPSSGPPSNAASFSAAGLQRTPEPGREREVDDRTRNSGGPYAYAFDPVLVLELSGWRHVFRDTEERILDALNQLGVLRFVGNNGLMNAELVLRLRRAANNRSGRISLPLALELEGSYLFRLDVVRSERECAAGAAGDEGRCASLSSPTVDEVVPVSTGGSCSFASPGGASTCSTRSEADDNASSIASRASSSMGSLPKASRSRGTLCYEGAAGNSVRFLASFSATPAAETTREDALALAQYYLSSYALPAGKGLTSDSPSVTRLKLPAASALHGGSPPNPLAQFLETYANLPPNYSNLGHGVGETALDHLLAWLDNNLLVARASANANRSVAEKRYGCVAGVGSCFSWLARSFFKPVTLRCKRPNEARDDGAAATRETDTPETDQPSRAFLAARRKAERARNAPAPLRKRHSEYHERLYWTLVEECVKVLLERFHYTRQQLGDAWRLLKVVASRFERFDEIRLQIAATLPALGRGRVEAEQRSGLAAGLAEKLFANGAGATGSFYRIGRLFAEALAEVIAAQEFRIACGAKN